MKIFVAQINPTIGDLVGNSQLIVDAIDRGLKAGADVVLLPEMCLTGYPPEDFLLLPHFIDDTAKALEGIAAKTKGIAAVVGTVRRSSVGGEKKLHNSAAVIVNGVIEGYHDKILLPTYDVFDERRFFDPGESVKLWSIGGQQVGITICEDIWQHCEAVSETKYARDPVVELAKLSPVCVLNLSASPYCTQKPGRRIDIARNAARAMNCPLALCNEVGGNDSLIFDGYSLCVDAKGELTALGKGFATDEFLVDTDKKGSILTFTDPGISDVHKALVLGLKDYFHKSKCTKACVGLSGGIDSAVVVCIAVEALGKENVLGVLMPSRYTSKESTADALALAKTLGIRTEEISIEPVFKTYLESFEPHFKGKPIDSTEENIQARIRGMILMALSNKFGYIVLSTGNKSELAMGYATLYGDMCGGLAVINDLSKQQVYALAHEINKVRKIIPENTIVRPPSAELREGQKDTDTLPDYSVVDAVLEAYIEKHESPEKIAKEHKLPLDLVQSLIKRIHANEYKRRQSAPGLRVTQKAFSIGRRFPIVQKYV